MLQELNKLLTQLFKILSCIITHSIPEKHPLRSALRQIFLEGVVSSRIIEYPFVFKNLIDIPKGGKILDVGCCYSLLSIHLASVGYKVYGLDIEEYHYIHPNFRFVKGDIRKTSFPDEYFDAVVAISTIEHVGIPFSFQKMRPFRGKSVRGDLEAIKEIYRILKTSGIFLITLPIGERFVETRAHRIYDKKEVESLLKDFKVKSIEVFVNKSNCWLPSTYDKVEKISTADGLVRAVICIKARKTKIDRGNNNVLSS
jgi:SAM-dependent methyltransferase